MTPELEAAIEREPACRDCRFSDPHSYPMTYCHRYAPRENRQHNRSLFPQVHQTDWCGEFEARATKDD